MVARFDVAGPDAVRHLWKYVNQTEPEVIALALRRAGPLGWADLDGVIDGAMWDRSHGVLMGIDRLRAELVEWRPLRGRRLVALGPA